MDETPQHEPAPTALVEIPQHVRRFLYTLSEEDIARFHKWQLFIAWAETTGRYGKFLLWLSLAIFGASVSVAQGWDWMSRWWSRP